MEEILANFGQLTDKKRNFKKDDAIYNANLREFTKKSYDFVKSQETKRKNDTSLPFLHVEGLDAEQIFQQVELLNNDSYNRLLRDCNRLDGLKDGLEFEELQESESEDDEETFAEVDRLIGKKETSNGERQQQPLEDGSEDFEDENDEEMGENDEEDEDDDEEDEDDIDYFKKVNDEEEIEDMNAEFFGENAEGGGDIENFDDLDNMVDELESGKRGQKRPLDDEEQEEDDSAEEEFIDESQKVGSGFDLRDDDETRPDAPKSTYELTEERRQRQIRALEEEAMKDKEWFMKGEVRAKDRPEGSAIPELLQHKVAVRPVPEMTAEVNQTLEDIIKRRIKDKAYDDVVRKVRPTETPVEFKKKLKLNQEKSKESLAQIYEKEYQKQVAAVNGEGQMKDEPPLFNELRKMQHELFSQLDALTNFHFIPRPAIPQLKVKTNLPVLEMEEVGPLPTSDAMALAPEEIAPKIRGDLIGKTERTKTDKLRERRKKKKFQKEKANREELKKAVATKTNATKKSVEPKISKKSEKNKTKRG